MWPLKLFLLNLMNSGFLHDELMKVAITWFLWENSNEFGRIWTKSHVKVWRIEQKVKTRRNKELVTMWRKRDENVQFAFRILAHAIDSIAIRRGLYCGTIWLIVAWWHEFHWHTIIYLKAQLVFLEFWILEKNWELGTFKGQFWSTLESLERNSSIDFHYEHFLTLGISFVNLSMSS